MPCNLIEPIEKVDIEVQLIYQYDRLRLIFNNDETHPFIKGFKYCMEFIINENNAEPEA